MNRTKPSSYAVSIRFKGAIRRHFDEARYLRRGHWIENLRAVNEAEAEAKPSLSLRNTLYLSKSSGMCECLATVPWD